MSAFTAPERQYAMDGFAVGTMTFLTLVWGLNTVTSKVAVNGLDPMFLSFLRAVISMVALYAWCRYRGITIFVPDGQLLSGSLVGLLFGVEFVLIYLSLDLTSASRANLMTNTMPLFALIGGHFLLGERATTSKTLGAIISFVGVGVMFFDKLSLPSPKAIYSDLLCMAGGTAWAATAIAIRETNIRKLTPEKTLLYQLAGAALVVLPFLPFKGVWVRDLNWLVFGSLMFQSVFGVLFSGILLKEPLTFELLAGLCLVVAGLILANGASRKVLP
jgi:drug/metabolite transporter (DMT)-like permease